MIGWSAGRVPSGWGRVLTIVMLTLAALAGSVREASAAGPARPTAYVVNSASNTITPIDLATNTPEPVIHVGNDPGAIAITPDGTTAYVVDQNGNAVTPINLATNTAEPQIPVGSTPEGVAITPDGTTAYVANTGADTVTPIDLATNTPEPAIPVGAGPQGVAITPDGTTAYVVNDGANSVTPINLATNTPEPQIPVGITPEWIAIAPDGMTAYVTDTGDGTVTPIDLATNTPKPAIAAGNSAFGLAITPDGATAYVANGAASGAVIPIDLATNAVQPSIPAGNQPIGVAITPDGTAAYVTNLGDDTVTPIDLATNTPGTAIRVGSAPVAVAIAGTWPPSAAITAPTDGATYTQGQVVDAGYSCAEGAGGPGLKPGSAGCAGTVANGAAIDTTTPGPHAFSVTATSQDGQTATRSITYTVVAAAAPGPPAPPPPVTVTGPACAPLSGRLHSPRLGPVALGMTRAQVHRALPGFRVTHNHYDRSCLAGGHGKLRVAYPTRRLLKTLTHRQRRRLRGRVMIALTANRHYALDGIRPRTSIDRVHQHLIHARPLQIGVNTWYFIAGRHATGVLKVQHKVVGEIGIANRTLTRTQAQRRRLLTSMRPHPAR